MGRGKSRYRYLRWEHPSQREASVTGRSRGRQGQRGNMDIDRPCCTVWAAGRTLAFAPGKVGAVEGSEQEGQDLTRCSQVPFGTLWTD